MASIPKASFVLAGLGVDELSVVPSIYPEIKQIIRTINFEEVKVFSEGLLNISTEEEIRKNITEYFDTKILPAINLNLNSPK